MMKKINERILIGGILLVSCTGILAGIGTFLAEHTNLFEDTAWATADTSHFEEKTTAEETSSVIGFAKVLETSATIEAEPELEDSVHLSVPQLNQMDAPRLYNGCEVTSLAMLLNYHGFAVNKNQLAEAIPTINYLDEDGFYGNPNQGFVGDMTGNNGSGYFVYHQPIFNVADSYSTESLVATDLSGQDFTEVKAALSAGSPVWVITTTTFSPVSNLETWETQQGAVTISMSEHSVVLVGYDEESIYLNDPYGNQNYATDLEQFVASWELMGSQAVAMLAI